MTLLLPQYKESFPFVVMSFFTHLLGHVTREEQKWKLKGKQVKIIVLKKHSQSKLVHFILIFWGFNLFFKYFPWHWLSLRLFQMHHLISLQNRNLPFWYIVFQLMFKSSSLNYIHYTCFPILSLILFYRLFAIKLFRYFLHSHAFIPNRQLCQTKR